MKSFLEQCANFPKDNQFLANDLTLTSVSNSSSSRPSTSTLPRPPRKGSSSNRPSNSSQLTSNTNFTQDSAETQPSSRQGSITSSLSSSASAPLAVSVSSDGATMKVVRRRLKKTQTDESSSISGNLNNNTNAFVHDQLKLEPDQETENTQKDLTISETSKSVDDSEKNNNKQPKIDDNCSEQEDSFRIDPKHYEKNSNTNPKVTENKIVSQSKINVVKKPITQNAKASNQPKCCVEVVSKNKSDEINASKNQNIFQTGGDAIVTLRTQSIKKIQNPKPRVALKSVAFQEPAVKEARKTVLFAEPASIPSNFVKSKANLKTKASRRISIMSN